MNNGGEFCAEDATEEDAEALPTGLKGLLQRLGSLYQRALRLEEMLKGSDAVQ